MRLIHIVENMHDQAVENWIFRIMRDSRRTWPDHHWTFYCVLDREGRLDAQVRELGGELCDALRRFVVRSVVEHENLMSHTLAGESGTHGIANRVFFVSRRDQDRDFR